MNIRLRWDGFAGHHIKHPSVPGTCQLVSPEFPDPQRGPGVRAAVEERDELTLDAADEDHASVDLNRLEPFVRKLLNV